MWPGMAAPAGTGVVGVGVGVLTIGVGVGDVGVVPTGKNLMLSRLWYPVGIVTRRTCLPAVRVTCVLTSLNVFQPPVFGTETVPFSVPSTASLKEVPDFSDATLK